MDELIQIIMVLLFIVGPIVAQVIQKKKKQAAAAAAAAKGRPGPAAAPRRDQEIARRVREMLQDATRGGGERRAEEPPALGPQSVEPPELKPRAELAQTPSFFDGDDLVTVDDESLERDLPHLKEQNFSGIDKQELGGQLTASTAMKVKRKKNVWRAILVEGLRKQPKSAILTLEILGPPLGLRSSQGYQIGRERN